MSGAELREARKAAGLSMKQAAEESGTPYRTWQDWEGGKRRVPGLAFAWLSVRTKQETASNNARFYADEAFKLEKQLSDIKNTST